MGGKPRRKPSLWVSRDEGERAVLDLWSSRPTKDARGVRVWVNYEGYLESLHHPGTRDHLDLVPGDCIPLYAGRRRRGR